MKVYTVTVEDAEDDRPYVHTFETKMARDKYLDDVLRSQMAEDVEELHLAREAGEDIAGDEYYEGIIAIMEEIRARKFDKAADLYNEHAKERPLPTLFYLDWSHTKR